MPKLKVAVYRTKRGAARYAFDLASKHAGHAVEIVPNPLDPFNGFAVLVTTPAGRKAYAARRPRGFGQHNGG